MTTINIGGQEREIRYPFEAVRKIETQLGMTTGEILEKVSTGTSINATIVVVWGGLIHSAKKLTVDMVSSWLDKEEGSYFKVAVACMNEYADSVNKKLSFEQVTDEEDNSKN